jgi:hypothetical protein
VLRLREQVRGRDRRAVGPGVEHRRGVGHGLVEEQREQVVRQVVVTADVAARAFPGLRVIRRLLAHRELAQPLLPGRHEVAHVGGEDGEQAGQVGAVPVAGHVRLAEADQAGGAEAAEEVPGPVQDHDRGGRRTPADQLSVREPDPQRQLGAPRR